MRGLKYYFFNVFLVVLLSSAFFILIIAFTLPEPTRYLGKVIIALFLCPAIATILVVLSDMFGNETPDETSDEDND